MWVAEAVIILGLSVTPPVGAIADTPFWELNQCWLDEEKKISTIEAFTDPRRAALQGAIWAAAAKPRAPITDLRAPDPKHSPRWSVLHCALRTSSPRSTRMAAWQKRELTRNLMLPRSMFDLITKFENFRAFRPGRAATTRFHRLTQ